MLKDVKPHTVSVTHTVQYGLAQGICFMNDLTQMPEWGKMIEFKGCDNITTHKDKIIVDKHLFK